MGDTPPEWGHVRVRRTWERIYQHVDELMQAGQHAPLWLPRVGSALYGDDRRTDPWLVTTAAHAPLLSALDHLHALASSVLQGPYLYPYSPFTLTRSALESAAASMWIAGPTTRATRLVRALRWYATDAIDGDQAATEFGVERPRPLAERLRDLQACAEQNGCDPSAATTRVNATAMLREADSALADKGSLSPLSAWRLCSGFAHGRPWAAVGLLNRESRKSDRPGIHHDRQTNSPGRILFPALAAHQLFRSAVDTYERRGWPPGMS